MAFPLFPRSPGKGKPAGSRAKPEPARPTGGNRTPVSARELAAAAKGRPAKPAKATIEEAAAEARDRDITVTGPPSLTAWTPGHRPGIQVAEANPGLCEVLENAALLYSSGQAEQALQVLEHGVVEDKDARLSPLAWLALFDLLQRAGDRTAFDRVALQYVVALERSAPAWEEHGPRLRAGARPLHRGYVGLIGKLSAAHARQIANLLVTTQKQPQVRLDLASLTGADDAGAKLLADALAHLRKGQYPLTLQHPEKILNALENAVKQGRAAGEGYWILLLELLQWQHDHDVFEDRAVDFAVTFEVSPPSWEPPTIGATAPAALAGAALDTGVPEDTEVLVWSGTMIGSSDAQLARLSAFAENRNIVAVDMSAVDRIDFICAGSLLNQMSRTEAQRKTVQIVGASAIIRALLLLLGISPRHFIKKAQ